MFLFMNVRMETAVGSRLHTLKMDISPSPPLLSLFHVASLCCNSWVSNGGSGWAF